MFRIVARNARLLAMGRQGTGISKDQWYEAGQEILKSHGVSAITLKTLTSALGVTSGSFYHHFRNMRHYLDQLALYYADEQHKRFLREAELIATADPISRLQAISSILRKVGGRQLSTAMRAWGRGDPAASKAVRKVDASMIGFCRKVFADLDFDEEQATARAALILALSTADVDFSLTGRSLKQLTPIIYEVLS